MEANVYNCEQIIGHMDLKKYFFIGIIVILYASGTNAQNNSQIELDLQAEPLLSNSQLINLVSLALDESGQGARLFTFAIQNASDSESAPLFIEYTATTSRFGLIIEAVQRNGTPFRLQSGQIVVASNNDIARSKLPGIPGMISFKADFTNSGEDFLNSLKGSNKLPIDVYTITMRIFSDANSQNGGNFEISKTVTIGENLVDDDQSIFSLSPGDVAGSDMIISNPFPEFRWEGRPDQTYRLIVVKKVEGEDPETLIESALSTDASERNGSANLLQFENLDVLTQGTSFQFPTSGIQPLRAGETYYWQVFASLRSSQGEDIRSSEIWEFTLSNRGANGEGEGGLSTLIEMEGDIFLLLRTILGEEKALELQESGYRLSTVEIDDSEFSGQIAREQLEDLLEKLRDGKLKFTGNPQ